MSKAQKILQKILSGQSDKNIMFDEAVYVLRNAGFIYDGGKGSHQVYRNIDGRKMVLPRHGKEIKPVYVRQIRELLK
jgi:predicted RNA binding protein YcfA (HicA-like mRNA interferase family)